MLLSPADLLIRVAGASVGASEVPANSNAGPFVERCLRITGLGKGHPWCAAVVAMWGLEAFGAKWALPKTASCYQLGEYARVKEALDPTPAVGDVFLLHYPSLNRFAHTGIVVGVSAGTIETIEGNTNDGGSREGWLVARKRRTPGERDRFIRWTTLFTGD